MKYLWSILLLWSAFVFFCFGFRMFSVNAKKKKALGMIQRTTKLPPEEFEIESMNELRGDYYVNARSSGLRWTINLPMSRIYSWQSKSKEGSVLRNLLRN